jgi:hypothetical protein
MRIPKAIRVPANLILAVLVMAVLTMSAPSKAATLRYRTGGPWEDVSDGATNGWGLNPANPGVDVPMPGDVARVNWSFSTVTLDYEAPSFDRLQIGVDESGVLEVNSGGVLTTIQDVNVGHNGIVDGIMDINDGGIVNVGTNLFVGRVNAETRGFLTINRGGVMNVQNHLWLGGKGEAFVNISGTLNQADGILGLGSQDFNLPGGTATLNVLDGGELNLFNIHAGGTQLSIQPGSKLDIFGTGRVTLPGNFVAVLEGYRDAGLIFGNSVAGAVDISVESVSGGAGDFDSDGDVDGQDFLVWQRDPSVGSLAEWEANLGTAGQVQTVVTASSLAQAAATSVPEPAAWTLALVGCCLVRRARR